MSAQTHVTLIFLGYDSNSSSYRVFNKRILTVESFVHITFDETNLPKVEKGGSLDVDRLADELEDLDLIKDDEVVAPTKPAAMEDVPTEAKDLPRERR